MTVRDGWKKLADTVKGITLPSALDARPHRMIVRTRTWSGEAVGQGTYTDSDLVIPQKYRIRGLASHEVVASGGRYELMDIKVTGLTQATADGTVGYTSDQLQPPIAASNVEVIYIIIGNNDGEYDLVALDGWKILSWEMILRKKAVESSRSPRIRTQGYSSAAIDSA